MTLLEQRQPRELLDSIAMQCANEHMDEDAGSPWGVAAFHAWYRDVCPLSDSLPPDLVPTPA